MSSLRHQFSEVRIHYAILDIGVLYANAFLYLVERVNILGFLCYFLDASFLLQVLFLYRFEVLLEVFGEGEVIWIVPWLRAQPWEVEKLRIRPGHVRRHGSAYLARKHSCFINHDHYIFNY